MASASAVILGDYPLSGSVPWLAALIIPAVVGVTMTAAAGRRRVELWIVTGPLAAAALAWGVRIATGWGLDPTPASAWAAIFIGLAWPPAWAITTRGRTTRSPRAEHSNS